MKRTVLFILSCAVLVSAQDRPSSFWKEYVVADDGFAITAPGAPTHHADPSTPEFMVYSIPLPGTAILNLRVSHMKRDCSATLDQLRDGALQGKSGIDPASFKTISIGGGAGLEYVWLSPIHANSDRFYCVDGKFYAFSASWPRKEARPPNIAKVESSFHVLKADPSK